MRIGRLAIIRLRPGVNRQWSLHAYDLRKEDLTPQVQGIIARVARSAAKDYLEELKEANDYTRPTCCPGSCDANSDSQ